MAPFLHQNRLKQKWQVCKRKNKGKIRMWYEGSSQYVRRKLFPIPWKRMCEISYIWTAGEGNTWNCSLLLRTNVHSYSGRFFTGERFLFRARVPQTDRIKLVALLSVWMNAMVKWMDTLFPASSTNCPKAGKGSTDFKKGAGEQSSGASRGWWERARCEFGE